MTQVVPVSWMVISQIVIGAPTNPAPSTMPLARSFGIARAMIIVANRILPPRRATRVQQAQGTRVGRTAPGHAPRIQGDEAEQWTSPGTPQTTTQRLARLVNHVALTDEDIDHVMIGLGGLVAVETKWSSSLLGEGGYAEGTTAVAGRATEGEPREQTT